MIISLTDIESLIHELRESTRTMVMCFIQEIKPRYQENMIFLLRILL